jgi:FMN phosphatase YigB (HAD superfamily)
MVQTTEERLDPLVENESRGVPEQSLTLTSEFCAPSLPYHRWSALVAERGLAHSAHYEWPTEAGLDAIRDRALATTRTHRGEHAFFDLGGTLLYVSLSYGGVEAIAAARDRGELDRAEKWLRRHVPKVAPEESQRVSIEFWSQGRNGPYSVHRSIDVPRWSEIDANYPHEVRAELARLVDDNWRPSAGGRLLLWHGVPGTGKTHALRALAWEWRAWCGTHYITDPEEFFGSSEYMLDVLTNGEDDDDDKWRLLVLEDTGELLTSDAKARTGQGLSRFLNVVDGLIGQGLRVVVLVTTNEAVGSLHPAAARPGRCAASVEFVAFPPAEAREWLAAHDHEAAPSRAETLADLYARLAGVVVKTRAPVGFRM